MYFDFLKRYILFGIFVGLSVVSAILLLAIDQIRLAESRKNNKHLQ